MTRRSSRCKRLGCGGQQSAFYQHRRPAVVGVLLVVKGPADHVAVMPFTGADLNAKRQAVVIETSRKADGGNAKHVGPVSVAVRTFTEAAILWHGFVDGRHLAGRVDESIQVKAIEFGIIECKNLAPRSKEGGFCVGISFERGLLDISSLEHAGLETADNDRRERLTDGA